MQKCAEEKKSERVAKGSAQATARKGTKSDVTKEKQGLRKFGQTCCEAASSDRGDNKRAGLGDIKYDASSCNWDRAFTKFSREKILPCEYLFRSRKTSPKD